MINPFPSFEPETLSVAAAFVAVGLSVYVWIKSRQLLRPTERPILVVADDRSEHEENATENKLVISVRLQFKNTGKHPAESVTVDSCYGFVQEPKQLKLGDPVESANPVYPDYPFNLWHELPMKPAKGRSLADLHQRKFFYYCRLTYRDGFKPAVKPYIDHYYFFYNIQRKRLQDATQAVKERFQPYVQELLPIQETQ